MSAPRPRVTDDVASGRIARRSTHRALRFAPDATEATASATTIVAAVANTAATIERITTGPRPSLPVAARADREPATARLR